MLSSLDTASWEQVEGPNVTLCVATSASNEERTGPGRPAGGTTARAHRTPSWAILCGRHVTLKTRCLDLKCGELDLPGFDVLSQTLHGTAIYAYIGVVWGVKMYTWKGV